MSGAGWQQPAVDQGCRHMGLLGAIFTVPQHAPGHEWVCTCGKRFVVALKGQRKVLEEQR